MNKLKGVNKLNKAITTQLKPFGITNAILSDEYSYLRDSQRVSFKLTENTLEDKWFSEFIKERFGYNVRYPFIISILHEVGHHKTDDDISDGVYKFCEKEKARINKAMAKAKTEKTCKKIEWQYFSLPDELMATAWAIDYARKHPQEIERMWNKSREALIKFYEQNIDTDFESEV